MEKYMKEKNLDRRSFFKFAVAGAVVAPFILKATSAVASACPTTATAGPVGKQVAVEGVGMAKSLEYVTVAASSKNAKYAKGQDCGNCKYYNNKKEESRHAPCTMLGMKYVAHCGWCKSYLKK